MTDLSHPATSQLPPPAGAVDLSHPGAASVVGPIEVRDGDGKILGTITHNETV